MSGNEKDLEKINQERLQYIARSEEIHKVIMSHPQLEGQKVEVILDVLKAAISRDSLEEIEGDFL